MNHANLRDSARDFHDLVWPLLRNHLGGGDLKAVETVTEMTFAQDLDALGMTDAWQVISPFGLRGLATRLQWGESATRRDGRPWNSWSVRYRLRSGYPTEYQKLTMDGDWHRPSYFVQAYLKERKGDVLSAACIRTDDLRDLLLRGLHDQPRPNPIDGNLFVPVWWDIAETEGYSFWKFLTDDRSYVK